ncbi:MAG TPA: 3-isopropylmalate dehydrogenase [Gemmatimonadaceae bacterium]|nr:3-isopropylmalate dehydrogenase [Gemmatimonadaceae bacterium]
MTRAGKQRFTIALLPGDGIGPEVVAAARRVLADVAARSGVTFSFEDALIGGAAIDATGSALPEETTTLCRRADAVLLGAVGGPKWDDPSARVRPEQGLLAIRRALGLYANLRPVAPHPALVDASPLRADRLTGVDLLVVRELTGGIYFGDKGTAPAPGGGERAHDLCAYETAEIERIVRIGAELARGRRRRLTSVDKANVLETSRLWRRVATRVVAEEFPDVALDHVLVDSCAMHLVTSPARFDVIVTENMFGDILTDEAAVLTGSIGVLPSASLGAPREGRRVGLYEPIHGSAPDIAGRGIANPVGTILSAAMLLRHSLGLLEAARAIESAVWGAIAGGTRTRDLGGSASTSAMTEAVLDNLREAAREEKPRPLAASTAATQM